VSGIVNLDAETIPTLTHATERDVDLLLVEELIASKDFLIWMTAQVGWGSAPTSWEVLHSKRRTRNRREIDIFVEMWTDGNTKPAVLLIENKLSEDEQPDQAESYRDELARISDDCDFSAMALVCPENYAGAHRAFAEKFDVVVSYESIATFFGDRSRSVEAESAKRLAFRADLLTQAIHKFRRGYTPISNPNIGSFNHNYVALLARTAPEIVPGKSMLGDARPDESVSMIFDHAASLSFLPEDIRPRRFSHELGRNQDHRANYVAVTFAGWGPAFKQIEHRLLTETAGTGFMFATKPATAKRPNPGLVMSLPTKPADNQAAFETQLPSLTEGIEAARKLRNWLRENQHVLQGWKDAVRSASINEVQN
jgi:hypothetical protein